MLSCPLCEADIDVDEDELDEGDAISCDECGASLNVVGKDPIELGSDDDSEYEEEEDFQEDDEDEDDVDEEEEDY
jgi:alpha-aminoadipate/glutamate carrier protein LysW